MNFVIRLDISKEIGYGHFYRSITLAKSLRSRNDSIYLITQAIPEHLKIWLSKFSIKFFLLGTNITSGSIEDLNHTKSFCELIGNPDLLIIDHYNIDIKFEKNIRNFVNKILVIDDLANRNHDCDILLDQNLRHLENRYEKLLPKKSKVFLGPKYFFFREEFYDTNLSKSVREKLKNILIFMGGGDNSYEIIKVIKSIKYIKSKEIYWTLITGKDIRDINKIILLTKKIKNFKLITHTDEISKIISSSDLAIGTCGISAWERCILGLPSLVMITAENQKEDAEILEEMNAVINLGKSDKVLGKDIAKNITKLINNDNLLKSMSIASFKVLEGHTNAINFLKEEIILSL